MRVAVRAVTVGMTPTGDRAVTTTTLETGHIHFLYRPVVEEEDPEGLVDVQQFEVVLHPRHREHFRKLVVGRKRMPDIDDTEPLWGFVDQVTDDVEDLRGSLAAEDYETATRGRRRQPAARPAGEGAYAIVRRGRDTYLAYELELPEEPGEVQDDLQVEPQARLVLTVKNPDAGSPPTAGLPDRAQPDLPQELLDGFRGRRWIAADPVVLLDHEGIEFLLIGAERDAELEGKEPQLDEVEGRELTDLLQAQRRHHPVEPLFEGDWA